MDRNIGTLRKGISTVYFCRQRIIAITSTEMYQTALQPRR